MAWKLLVDGCNNRKIISAPTCEGLELGAPVKIIGWLVKGLVIYMLFQIGHGYQYTRSYLLR